MKNVLGQRAKSLVSKAATAGFVLSILLGTPGIASAHFWRGGYGGWNYPYYNSYYVYPYYGSCY